MSATVEAINNDQPERENGLCGLFNSIIDGFAKLCGCSETSSSSSGEEDPGSSTRDDTQFVNINIGEEFANNLIAKFSDSSLVLPNGFQPVIEVPVSLGKQLYAAYVESIFRQQEAHNQIVQDLIKEDEEFARRLQDEEDKYGTVKATPKPLSKKVELPEIHGKRKATVTYPDEDEECKYGKTKAAPQPLSKKVELPEFYGKSKAKEILPTFEEKPYSKESGLPDEIDLALATFDKPATFYREQAHQHFKKRNLFYKNAKQCLREQNHRLANYYYQKATEQTKFIEEANNRAAAAFLAENSRHNQKSGMIDLHHLYVREAIQALDIFLDEEIQSLQDEHLKTKTLIVITGRGKHSQDGIPKIKPAVIERLEDRKLKHSEINPGSLRVHIFKHSYLTDELLSKCV